MAKKPKASKVRELVTLILVAAVVWVGYPPGDHLAAWILGVPAVLLCWFSFLMPTRCDYQTKAGTPCLNRVRGKLRGCSIHSHLKRDAMFAALGLRNPGQRFRRMWTAPGTPVRTVPNARPADRPSDNGPANKRGAYDGAILVATLVGAGPAFVSLVTWLLALVT
jgi:hypothetical protein